jgi:hypothetical protein
VLCTTSLIAAAAPRPGGPAGGLGRQEGGDPVGVGDLQDVALVDLELDGGAGRPGRPLGRDPADHAVADVREVGVHLVARGRIDVLTANRQSLDHGSPPVGALRHRSGGTG